MEQGLPLVPRVLGWRQWFDIQSWPGQLSLYSAQSVTKHGGHC